MMPVQWLAGRAEADLLARRTDWAGTPLGPVHDWPQSLRTVIDLVCSPRALR